MLKQATATGVALSRGPQFWRPTAASLTRPGKSTVNVLRVGSAPGAGVNPHFGRADEETRPTTSLSGPSSNKWNAGRTPGAQLWRRPAFSQLVRRVHDVRGPEWSHGPDTDYKTDLDYTTSRNYSYLTVGAGGFLAANVAHNLVSDFLDNMNASADVLALSSVEVDLSAIPKGSAITIKWRGKPVFIRHRTEKEINEAVADDNASLPHPETDAVRTQKPEWLIVLGVCTHLGCVPLNAQGAYNGYFCPCHGSHYDTSGRIRLGPAPLNLEVPEYKFVDEQLVKIG